MRAGRWSSRHSVVLLSAAILMLGGCDFLKGSGGGVRTSPVVSDLRVSPASVLCGAPFVLSFEYDDLQNDVVGLNVTLQPEAGNPIQQGVSWAHSPGVLDLATSGLAKYTYRFACPTPVDPGDPGGRWVVKVELEDGKGHTSNTLTTSVHLISAS